MLGLAAQVQIYNFIWGKIAVQVTDMENYETDKEYWEAIVSRFFIFSFINSFTSLFYIAFFKYFREGCAPYDSCEDELAASLLSSSVRTYLAPSSERACP